MSMIYYDQSSQIKTNKCEIIVTFDTIAESKILDASDILPNLQKPWTIICKCHDLERIFQGTKFFYIVQIQ